MPASVARFLAVLLVDGRRRARTEGWRLPEEVWTVVRLLEDAGRAHAAARAAAGPAEPGGTCGIPPSGPSASLAGMSTADAAAALGCTERNVRALAERGTLPAWRAGRRWTFDPADVEARTAAAGKR